MSPIDVTATSFVQVAGWTLIHFVWQGTAIALAAAVVLRALSRRSADARYLVACAALAAMLAAPIATAAWLWPSAPVNTIVAAEASQRRRRRRSRRCRLAARGYRGADRRPLPSRRAV